MLNTTEIIISQYGAALAMLEQAVTHCPETLWFDENPKNRVWHTVFHVLFFAHFYLHTKEEDFIPWEKHVQAFISLKDSAEKEKPREPYSKAEMLEYIAFCQQQVQQRVATLDLEAPSGFSWLPFNKLELQFYNIRHIQHHTGEIYRAVLDHADEAELKWVGMKKPAA